MKYIVSACLAGRPCRFDGGHCLEGRIAELVRQGEAIPVCPEVLGGQSVPREPCEIQRSEGLPLTIISRSGQDFSAAYYAGAGRALLIAEKNSITRAILKTRSPSCGFGVVYDGTFSGKLVPGNGITAGLLHTRGFRIFTEQNLPPELG